MYSKNRLIDKANTWWVNEDWRIKEAIIYKEYLKMKSILEEEVEDDIHGRQG